MAHFARVNGNCIVKQVIVINNEELIDNGVESEAKGIAFCQSLFASATWVQTSYNGRIRKNYAGVGFAYDAGRDAFIPPTPYPSWLLDEATCQWEAPVPMPNDGAVYRWDEAAGEWVAA
jgi:hypothetical protein